MSLPIELFLAFGAMAVACDHRYSLISEDDEHVCENCGWELDVSFTGDDDEYGDEGPAWPNLQESR